MRSLSSDTVPRRPHPPQDCLPSGRVLYMLSVVTAKSENAKLACPKGEAKAFDAAVQQRALPLWQIEPMIMC